MKKIIPVNENQYMQVKHYLAIHLLKEEGDSEMNVRGNKTYCGFNEYEVSVDMDKKQILIDGQNSNKINQLEKELNQILNKK